VTVRETSGFRQGGFLLGVLLVGLALLIPSPTDGRELYRHGSTYSDLGATFKNLFLGNRYYEIPFVEDRTQASDFVRGR